jgi:hypothetical protein
MTKQLVPDTCLLDDDGCDGVAQFPHGDRVGFCASCWSALPRRTRTKIQRLARTAIKAGLVSMRADAAADTALDEALNKLRRRRLVD